MKTKLSRAHVDIMPDTLTVSEIYTFEVKYEVNSNDVNQREALMNQLENLARQYGAEEAAHYEAPTYTLEGMD